MNWKSTIAPVLASLRPKFLVLSVAMVTLGFSANYFDTGNWSLAGFAVVLFCSLLAHTWVNLHNEVTDTENGLDAITVKTPFSGGTGGLMNNPEALVLAKTGLKWTRWVLLCAFAGFVYVYGWPVLVFAGIGAFLMLMYSEKIVKYPLLYWFSAGLAFGPLMVLGSQWVAGQSLNYLGVTVAVISFFWVNNLLLLNQVPDFFADRKVGRKNILMKYGLNRSLQIYYVSALSSLILMLGLVVLMNAVLFWILMFFWSLVIFWQINWVIIAYQALPANVQAEFESLAFLGIPHRQNPSEKIITPTDNHATGFEWLQDWQKPLALNVIINILLPLSLSALLILQVS